MLVTALSTSRSSDHHPLSLGYYYKVSGTDVFSRKSGAATSFSKRSASQRVLGKGCSQSPRPQLVVVTRVAVLASGAKRYFGAEIDHLPHVRREKLCQSLSIRTGLSISVLTVGNRLERAPLQRLFASLRPEAADPQPRPLPRSGSSCVFQSLPGRRPLCASISSSSLWRRPGNLCGRNLFLRRIF